MIEFIRDKSIEEKIINYLKDKGARKIELFGSYVRGEKYNDIDVIVEFEKWPDLLAFIRYQLELEEMTGKRIDLIAGEESISRYILPYVNREKRVILEL